MSYYLQYINIQHRCTYQYRYLMCSILSDLLTVFFSLLLEYPKFLAYSLRKIDLGMQLLFLCVSFVPFLCYRYPRWPILIFLQIYKKEVVG